jgi:sugar lactone lactonase YvrE
VANRAILNRSALVLVAALLGAVLPLSPAQAAGHVETVVTFDPAKGELPEGVAVDHQGNVFVSLAPLGQLLKLSRKTGEPTVFGTVAGINPDFDNGLLGLTVDNQGNVYGAVQSANPDAVGVWKFDRWTGAATRIPGTEAMAFPNSVAFDRRGNLYITDSILGAVWRVPKKGGVAEEWIMDGLLLGNGILGFGVPIGANGIAVYKKELIVSNTEEGSLVSIPIGKRGAPGAPTMLLQAADITFPDGIALDNRGNIYVAVIDQSAVKRVDRSDLSVALIADADDGLDFPSSVAFGHGRTTKDLYAVNFAIGPPGGAGPALLKISP